MKCKNCKEKFDTTYFNEKYCKKDECKSIEVKKLLERKRREDVKKWKKEKAEIKEKLKTRADYVKELQVVFNKFIRLRDKGNKCISCDNYLKGKYDAGHFYSTGSYPELRFNELNVHGQCVYCNQHKRGNIHEYREGLIKRIGEKKLKELEQLKGIMVKPTIEELNGLKEVYKEKIKLLNNQ